MCVLVHIPPVVCRGDCEVCRSDFERTLYHPSLSNAGTIVGIGDFRQEKGRGSYGTFAVSGAEDMGDYQEIWDEITKEDREVQKLAMEQPICADEQTAELMQYLQEERLRRAA